jgi:hypothetical protein
MTLVQPGPSHGVASQYTLGGRRTEVNRPSLEKVLDDGPAGCGVTAASELELDVGIAFLSKCGNRIVLPRQLLPLSERERMSWAAKTSLGGEGG